MKTTHTTDDTHKKPKHATIDLGTFIAKLIEKIVSEYFSKDTKQRRAGPKKESRK